MAADAQVSEIDVLKAYAAKMNGLRNNSMLLSVTLVTQIRKMIDDYNDVLREMDRLLQSGEEDSRYIQERYRRAISRCTYGEEARPIIGESDMVAQQKYELLQMRVETVRNNIQNLQMKLKNAQIKTVNYQAQMESLGDACISFVKRYTEVLEQAKNIKK